MSRDAVRPEDQVHTYPVDFSDTFDSLLPVSAGRAVAEAIHTRTGVRPGSAVLELGVGNGRILVPLIEAGLRGTGVDISPDMLQRTTALATERGVEVEVLQADLREPADLGTFDLVTCVGVTISMMAPADQVRVLEHAAARVAPGGWLVVEAQHAPRLEAAHAGGEAQWAFPHEDGVISARSSFDPQIGEWWMRYSWGVGEHARTAQELAYAVPVDAHDGVLRAGGLHLAERFGSWAGEALSDASMSRISYYRREVDSHE